MVRSGRGEGAARSAAEGADLLAHVERDLVGCRLERRSPVSGVVTPPDAPAFEVEVVRERRRLIALQTLAVHVAGPVTPVTDTAIVFHHTGQLRRTGLVARVRGSRASDAFVLRDALIAADELERASLPLDFTRFEVRPHRGAWRATLELMGASHVRTTFPPASRYVRLDDEQRRSLLATVAVLQARLPGRAPAAPMPGELAPSRSRKAPHDDHLPGRPV